MPSDVENVIRGDDKVVEVSGELEGKTGKEVEVPQKPRPPPPFPQRLVKKIENGKYQHFITMLNNFPSMTF